MNNEIPLIKKLYDKIYKKNKDKKTVVKIEGIKNAGMSYISTKIIENFKELESVTNETDN